MTTEKTRPAPPRPKNGPERVTTPRGSFRIIAARKGDRPDLSVWIEHGEWFIVTDGALAYAVAKTDWLA